MAVQLLYVQLSVIALHVKIILTFFCYSYKFFFFAGTAKNTWNGNYWPRRPSS